MYGNNTAHWALPRRTWEAALSLCTPSLDGFRDIVCSLIVFENQVEFLTVSGKNLVSLATSGVGAMSGTESFDRSRRDSHFTLGADVPGDVGRLLVMG